LTLAQHVFDRRSHGVIPQFITAYAPQPARVGPGEPLPDTEPLPEALPDADPLPGPEPLPDPEAGPDPEPLPDADPLSDPVPPDPPDRDASARAWVSTLPADPKPESSGNAVVARLLPHPDKMAGRIGASSPRSTQAKERAVKRADIRALLRERRILHGHRRRRAT
jgi:hypothetical protein